MNLGTFCSVDHGHLIITHDHHTPIVAIRVQLQYKASCATPD